MAVQLTLQLQPGLTQRFKTLRAVTQHCALTHRGGVAAIAPAIDMSPSELGRKLTGKLDDPHRTLDIDDWVEAVTAMGDVTPIYWLVERFLASNDQRQEMLREQIAALMDQLEPLLAAVEKPTSKVVK